MLKNTLLTLVFGVFYLSAYTQNCPGYSSTSSGNAQACGNQNYTLTVPNTTCNGQIFFNVDWSFGSSGSNVSWQIESVQSGNIVAQGVGTNNGNGTTSIGPLDPNVEGNAFDLIITDASGVGFGATGSIDVSQGGSTIISLNYAGHQMFNANIVISSATITITTPSGPISSTVNNCNDFIVQIPLQNNNYCNPINITLPWTISCTSNGSTLASGSSSVIVNPQVPASAADLVDITWNAATCSWDVLPQNDCDALDINNIFSISPDPATLNSGSCGNGTENFTIDYLGITGAPNCCSTAGPLVNITYDDTLNSAGATVATSPFGGINNSALITFPPNNSGGNATAFNLCVTMSNFCFNTPDLGGDESFFVIIYVDGSQVYMSPQQFGTSFNTCLNLSNLPGGYNQSSTVQIYILPNVFYAGTPSTYSTYSPNANCGSLALGQWNATIDANINVTFDQMEGSAVICSFPLNPNYTCCTTPPSATPPAAITVDCANNVPAPDPASVTGATGTCTTPPTVTFVSDVSDGNTCNGEIITRTYSVQDVCGNSSTLTQTITISAQTPTFTLISTNPSICGASDGTITVGGLTPNTNYSINYNLNGTAATALNITTDASGNYIITGLGTGTYDNFNVGLGNCTACVGTNSGSISLVSGTAPLVNAGNDTTICQGSPVTLTAGNPNGATITWNNGVTDGIAFTPPNGTTTYTVSADLSGCISTDVVNVTVISEPIVNAGTDVTACQGTPITLTASNPNNATLSWNNSITNGVPFTQAIGNQTYTVTANLGACIAKDSVVVSINALPTVNAGNDTALCVGNTLTLTAYNPNNANISWNNGITDGVVFTPTIGSTSYTVTANLAGCIATDQILVTTSAAPIINAGQDISVCQGASVTLSATGGANYQWDHGVVDGQAFVPGIGTTTYIVTSTNSTGCTSTDSVVISVLNSVNGDFNVDLTKGCAPLTVHFSSTFTGTSCQYLLSNGAVLNSCNPSYTFDQGGCYNVTLLASNSIGCKDTISKQNLICVTSTPTASFTPDPTSIGGLLSEVHFNNSSTDAQYYQWEFGDGDTSNLSNPSHVYDLKEDKYFVTLIAGSGSGCTDTALTTIEVVEDLLFYIPNSFTPDNDNYNEKFLPVFTSGYDPYNYTFLIFDRYGEILFESHNAKVGWDGTYGGKICQDGAYVWKITFKSSNSDEKIERMGHFSLLR
jgi:gliding motility-associated-like protein